MALVNFLGLVNNTSDTRAFLGRYRDDYVPARSDFETELVAGGTDEQSWNTKIKIEGDLDAQAMLGIAYPTPLTTYNVGGRPDFSPSKMTPENTNEDYLT